MPVVDFRFLPPEALAVEAGRRIKALRIRLNLDQRTVAERAGVALRTLRGLEQGTGSTVDTLMRVLKALDAIQALEAFLPEPAVSPIALFESQHERQRASRRKASRP